MASDHAAARGTSSDTEISIGIFPADEAEAPRTEAAPDAGVGTDERYERSCLGHFSNPKIEAYYESERPGVNVETGHRQILVLHVVLTVARLYQRTGWALRGGISILSACSDPIVRLSHIWHRIIPLL